jgi:hypothetical protein
MEDETAAEILAKHIDDLPQPLRDVVRDYVGNSFDAFLQAMRIKYNLSEKNVNDLAAECMLILCDVNPIESLTPEIIGELDIPYDAAVQIERAFRNEFQNKIMMVAEERGYHRETD